MTQRKSDNQNLTAAIVGAGSIGVRHAQNLLALGVGKIIVTDPDERRLQEVTNSPGISSSSSLKEALDHGVDMALICSPSSEHLAQAELAVSSGVTTFIEKPITHNSEGVQDLLNIASEKSVNILVGCNFRFDSGYKLVSEIIASNRIGKVYGFRANFGQYLPDWRPGRNYLDTYSAHAAQGGGIVLDQIHEIDTITSLLGKAESISAKVRTAGELEIHSDNVADILMRLENGIVGTLHLDSLRRDYDRSIEIMGTDGTIRWSFQDNHVSLFNADSGWEDLSPSKTHDFNRMYVEEMEHFLRIVQGIDTPDLSGEDALTALKVAEAAQESSTSGNTILL